MRPDDLLELRVGLLLVSFSASTRRATGPGDVAGLVEPGVDEVLRDVLEEDRECPPRDGLGDLAAHGPRADDGGLEHEHCLL
jgi:hypothetical protein